MVGSVLIDTLACNMMTFAYQLDTSGFISLLFYISIVYSYLSDVFLFKEQIEGLEIIGVLLIFITTLTVATIKLRKSMLEEKANAVGVKNEDMETRNQTDGDKQGDQEVAGEPVFESKKKRSNYNFEKMGT